MADNLTDVGASEAMKWLVGQPAIAPVLPLECRLVTALGDDVTAGTEVTGDAYVPQDITVEAVGLDGATTNSALLSFAALDSAGQRTIAGVEVWDSAVTPVRWWHGALTEPKIVNAGDPCEFAPGTLVLSLD